MSEEKAASAQREQALKALVNEIVGDCPEVSIEIDGFQCTMFRVKGKSFVRIAGEELIFKASLETQEFLIQQEPYWKTAYFGRHGWVSTRATTPGCWEELKPLLLEAYQLTAPKSVLKQTASRSLST